MLKSLIGGALLATVLLFCSTSTHAQYNMVLSNLTQCEVDYELTYATAGTCNVVGNAFGTLLANSCPTIAPPPNQYIIAVTFISQPIPGNRSTVGSTGCPGYVPTGSVNIGTNCNVVNTGYASPNEAVIQ